jgi:hypothetical protein
MMKIPISMTTRSKALEALNSLESEKVLELARVAWVNPYYEKTIEQSLQRDRDRAKEWLGEPEVSIVPRKEHKGPSDAQRMLAMVSRYEGVDVPRYGPPGSGRISHEVNHATALTLGSAKAQGDTLHVKQPKLDMSTKKAKEAVEEVFSSPGEGTTEGDGGGGGYGF